MTKLGAQRFAAGQGGGNQGLAAWGEARPMVRGSPVGVSGKRWVREWGFEAGHAVGWIGVDYLAA